MIRSPAARRHYRAVGHPSAAGTLAVGGERGRESGTAHTRVRGRGADWRAAGCLPPCWRSIGRKLSETAVRGNLVAPLFSEPARFTRRSKLSYEPSLVELQAVLHIGRTATVISGQFIQR